MNIATVFPNLAATVKREVSFDALLAKIADPPERPRKEACELFSLGRFGEIGSDRDSLRHDGNVLSITGITGDYDGEQVPMEQARDALGLLGVESTLYTSPSHRPDAPRWRVVCPLSKDHPTADHGRLMARLNGVLGGILAPESFTLSQSYYFGKVRDAEYQTLTVNGLCVDELPELDDFAIGKSGPAKPGNGTSAPAGKLTDDDLRAVILQGVAGRVYTSLLSLTSRLAARGKTADAIVTDLRELLMRASWQTADPVTWQERIKALPRMAQSAIEKFGPPKPAGTAAPLVAGPARAVVGDLRTVEFPAPAFLIERILPVAVARVVGAGKLGKSTLLQHMAMSVVLGSPWFGHRIERPGAVLIVTAEDTRDDMLYRLQRLARAADFDDNEVATLEEAIYIEDWSGDERGRIAEPDAHGNIREAAAVDALIDAYQGAGVTLVLLDPLSLLGPGERFVNDGEIACARIARKISRALDCTVLIVHHVSQNVARSGIADQHAGRGGTAGADNSRAVWQISGPPQDRRPPEVERALTDGNDVLYLHVHAVSYGPPVREPIIIERSGWHFAPLAVTETSEPDGGIDREAQAAADVEILAGYFRPGDDYKPAEIESGTSLPRARARAALARLEREGRVVRHIAERKGPGRRTESLRLAPAQGHL